MAIEIEVRNEDGNTVIAVSGEVDLYSSPGLRDKIIKATRGKGGAVGIDLSQVKYMDSSGVATLVEGLKESGKKKRVFALIAPSQSVMKVLQLSRLDSVFDIRDAL